jgi:hypothetical protein
VDDAAVAGPADAPSAAAVDAAPHPEPTAELWRRRSPRSPAIPCATALTGVDGITLADATAIALAASDEAAHLLEGMEMRIRTLPTTVRTSAERCINSVRGPIMWAETMTARANALGNDDVFVCMTTERSFDTVENQLLVDALESIAAAEKALRGPTGERVAEEDAARIEAVAREAAAWRRDSRLAPVRPGRLTGRAAARVRGGHRKAKMEPVLAVRRRAREPFLPEDVVGLTDEWTRALHRTVLRVMDAMERPRVLTLSDGGLWCRTLSFRHPAAPGAGPAGLAVRGRPVLPPHGEVDDAPWASLMPRSGVRIPAEAGPQEIRALLAQSRSSSTSGSSSSTSS